MKQPFFCAGYDPEFMRCEKACLIICCCDDDRGDEGRAGGCKWLEEPCCVCHDSKVIE